jgi:acyl-homoserine lactone acylase PvdQ
MRDSYVSPAWLTALLAALLAGLLYLRQSLPKTEGEIRLPASARPVEILRDRYGIPHIFAASLETRASRSATCTRRTASGRWK